MYCPNCGNQNDDQANYCKVCGTSLRITDTDQTAPPTLSTGLPLVTYAGFWRRFGAFLIDQIIIGIGAFIIGFILGFLYVFITGTDAGLEIWAYLLGILFDWLYFAILESSPSQATPGKMALGIKVTDMNGSRISFARATGRYFAKYLSSAILLIGYIMIAFTEKKQGLHDILAGTLVILK
jgi:uncharacterized RDD family membrane protein YckC